MSKGMTIEQARNTLRNAAWLGTNEDRERIEKAVELLCGEQCEDSVSRGVFEQVMWERDVAIDQLKELGYGFGEKQRTGHWIFEEGDGKTCFDGYVCSACNKSFHTHVPYFAEYEFCPHCGADMRESEEQA